MEPLEGKMPGTSSPTSVSTKLQRIAEQARASPGRALTTLAHHIDLELMHEAYRRTRKSGAVGVDRQTAEEFAQRLDENLRSLLDRLKSGRYRAPPVRRVYIPKEGGKTRPIGIPTFEDKVLQRAVAMVLEAVYEQDFMDCSYGFRPGRSCHQALDGLGVGLIKVAGGAVLEVDIKGFFDSLDHHRLREILDLRVRDGVLRRTIDKWLKAGVMEGGALHRPVTGTPQGGVISPLLANIYLHEVLDRWFEQEVKPRLHRPAFLIRYADDFVIVFVSERDALRVTSVLPKRFGRYGLTLHPTKTRLVRFLRPGCWRAEQAGMERPDTFELLGFTLFWALSRRGKWYVARKTSSRRFRSALRRVSEWCKENRHVPVSEQHKYLSAVLRGHYGYFGVTGNIRALQRFRWETGRAWRRGLNRRSGRTSMNWQRFNRLLVRYPLPPARVVHSIERTAATP